MSQQLAEAVAVLMGGIRAPADAQHYPTTRHLDLGAATVVLHSYPSRLTGPAEADELLRRQIAFLRELADYFESTLGVPTGSNPSPKAAAHD